MAVELSSEMSYPRPVKSDAASAAEFNSLDEMSVMGPTTSDAVDLSAEPVVGSPDTGQPVVDEPSMSDVSSEPSTLFPTLSMASFVVAVTCSLGVLMQMRPWLLVDGTTPSGGDMGAHVWGPAFLRDYLLSQGKLAGWTPDWYAGFPAYHFYMVIPSLAIVILNVGFKPIASIPITLVLVGGAAYLWRVRQIKHGRRVMQVALIVALLLAGMPYGTAFKLVSVSGIVGLPLAAWWMAKQLGSREPVPAMAALAATVFLFDTNFSIYGGNIASTLAGEFAFSISLTVALLAFGFGARGMDTGRWRGRSAVVIALVALTHVIPVFFMVVGLAVLVLLPPKLPRMWPLIIFVGFGLGTFALDTEGGSIKIVASLGAVLLVLAGLLTAEPEVRARAGWLFVAGPVGMALSAFWLVPFYIREPYFNDMGWERLEEVADAMLTSPMVVALPLALVGAILSIAMRERVGVLFAILSLVGAGAVANLPEGALWNARLLPFFYLSVYLCAATGIGLVVRLVSSVADDDIMRFDQPRVSPFLAGLAVVTVITGIGIMLPLRVLPGGTFQPEGKWKWLGITSNVESYLTSWVPWNYEGYESKASYGEYQHVVSTMSELGARPGGCGRAMWEYDKGLDRYGTPMALMLLPHWTDGCISSMEGLYFESSGTTPFHFLNQSVLSENPSRAQRDLPYQSFDIDLGVAQLQVMGVRYYMALSDKAIEAASSHPELTQVAEAQPFVVFEVAGSELVSPLEHEPVIASGPNLVGVDEVGSRFEKGWVSQAVSYYNSPTRYRSMPAAAGPSHWEEVTVLLFDDGVPLGPVEVSDIDVGTSDIRFSVDQIGVPVLVKMSYFPNWEANGADGPWQAGPNLMVVIPTDTDVELSYGYTWVEWLGYLITLAGVGLVIVIGIRQRTTPRSDTTQVDLEVELPVAAPEGDDVEMQPLPVGVDNSAEKFVPRSSVDGGP